MDPNPPGALFFKSSAAAFEYACEYLDNSLAYERQVLGYVLAVKGRKCIVKFANDKDKTLPTGSADELLERVDVTTISYGAELLDNVPNLKRGDLVMFVSASEAGAAGKPGLAGIITAKVKPIYILSKGGWQLFPVEH